MKSRELKYLLYIMMSMVLFMGSCFDVSRDNPLDSKADNFIGLIGYWNFDEAGVTTVKDLSTYGNNGTLNAAYLSFHTDCPFIVPNNKTSIYFGPAAPTGDAKVVINNSQLFSFSETYSQFTIELWVKISWPLGAGNYPLVSKTFSNAVTTGWKLDIYSDGTNNMAQLNLSEDGATWNLTLNNTIKIPQTVWCHIACTVDVGADSYIMYIDGASGGSYYSITGSLLKDIQSTSYNLTIGATDFGGTPAFGTFIDEVKIYSKVLSPAMILAHSKGQELKE